MIIGVPEDDTRTNGTEVIFKYKRKFSSDEERAQAYQIRLIKKKRRDQYLKYFSEKHHL